MLVGGATACGGAGGAHTSVNGVTVSRAVAWGFPGSGSITVGCRIASSGGDSLLAVASPVAAHTQLHNVVTSNGVSRMVPAAAVPLPAGSTVTLGTGGYHVMMDSLAREVAVGDSVSVTFTFSHAGAVTLGVPMMRFGDAQDLLKQ